MASELRSAVITGNVHEHGISHGGAPLPKSSIQSSALAAPLAAQFPTATPCRSGHSRPICSAAVLPPPLPPLPRPLHQPLHQPHPTVDQIIIGAGSDTTHSTHDTSIGARKTLQAAGLLARQHIVSPPVQPQTAPAPPRQLVPVRPPSPPELPLYPTPPVHARHQAGSAHSTLPRHTIPHPTIPHPTPHADADAFELPPHRSAALTTERGSTDPAPLSAPRRDPEWDPEWRHRRRERHKSSESEVSSAVSDGLSKALLQFNTKEKAWDVPQSHFGLRFDPAENAWDVEEEGSSQLEGPLVGSHQGQGSEQDDSVEDRYEDEGGQSLQVMLLQARK